MTVRATVSPDFETVAAAFERGETAVLQARRVDDLLTPVAAYLKLARNRADTFLLESVEGGAWRGRYSAIGLDPDLIWQCRNGQVSEARGLAVARREFTPVDEPPMQALRRVIEDARCPLPDGAPPLASGLFGYVGYDMVRYLERLPEHAAPDPLDVPESCLLRPRVMVVFDALKQEIQVYSPVRPGEYSAREAYDAAVERMQMALDALAGGTPDMATPDGELGPRSSNQDDATYREAVDRARGYIRAGDAFQVVPSQRFSADYPADPFWLYRSLRRLNPSPFLFFFRFDGFEIVGSSPEILVRLRDGTVTVRPIAGTRPRGKTPAEDDAFEADLLADPKERAEHLMLLDLGRNDVGRVAKPGSVRITSREIVERYSHVMHIVSNVEGDLAEGEDAVSALFAGFPAGTVSGAPKVRAMEIIDELEPHRRGIYSGAVGYFSADGGMDTCIALRTAVVKDGRIHVQAGAGVVLDSDPESERVETVNKAAALFRAAEDSLQG
ncbi:anthranilate synthase component I [Maricaulis sp.]|uniref:anthranilate synthase component I n=1 Tax=Maricaulis sp. TaxID=1486257 RepID=UPI001B2055BA|nr:anthranilate synthase component I [Maricaulis sp.]MBO6764951.1 anthranilate synthase component I [Maricaulis sp.]